MPNYEYECTTCGVHFERTQKFTDEPMQICPECGGKVRKLFFPVGIIFKGSGWYKTDHGAGGAIPPAKTDESAPPAKPDTAKSDSAKPDTAKSDSAKSDATKSDSGKAEGGRSDSGASSAKTDTKKAESKTDKS